MTWILILITSSTICFFLGFFLGYKNGKSNTNKHWENLYPHLAELQQAAANWRNMHNT